MDISKFNFQFFLLTLPPTIKINIFFFFYINNSELPYGSYSPYFQEILVYHSSYCSALSEVHEVLNPLHPIADLSPSTNKQTNKHL